jgi:hypothetical protein
MSRTRLFPALVLWGATLGLQLGVACDGTEAGTTGDGPAADAGPAPDARRSSDVRLDGRDALADAELPGWHPTK